MVRLNGRRPDVVILHGAGAAPARPDEEDTLIQAQAVRGALHTLGHRVQLASVGFDLRALETLAAARPKLVFNLVEAIGGRGQLHPVAPLALEAMSVPHTGCPGDALVTTSHKVLAKRMMDAAGIPTPEWIEPDAMESASIPTGMRYIVKSVWEDASVGLFDNSVASGPAIRSVARERRRTLGGQWFAERYIDGREFNLSLLETATGPTVLPVAETVFVGYPPGAPRIVDYKAKWDPDSPGYRNTPRRFDFPATDRDLLAELRRLALACWRLFGLRGYARVDFRVDRAGAPWALEINGNPCLSPDAGFAAAAERARLSYESVIETIVAEAAARQARRADAAHEHV